RDRYGSVNRLPDDIISESKRSPSDRTVFEFSQPAVKYQVADLRGSSGADERRTWLRIKDDKGCSLAWTLTSLPDDKALCHSGVCRKRHFVRAFTRDGYDDQPAVVCRQKPP